MIAITIQFETNPKATWRDTSCKMEGVRDHEGSWQEPPPMCAPKALMHAENQASHCIALTFQLVWSRFAEWFVLYDILLKILAID